MPIGELSALLTSVFWSLTPFFFAAAADRIGSLQLNVNRLIFAAVFLFLTLIIFNINYFLSSDQIIYLSISGVLGLVLGDTFLFSAFRRIGPRLSILMMALAPGMSALGAYLLFDERLSIWGILGMIITLGGIGLVVMHKSTKVSSKYKFTPIGIFYGFMGAFGQAAGLVFAKLAFQEGDINGFAATFIRIISAIILILPGSILIRRYKNPVRLYLDDNRALIFTMLGTIFGPYLGITFSLIAVAHTSVGIAATLMSLMPVMMLPISKYVYREKLSWQSIMGAFIAVVGVSILFMR